MRFMKVDAHGWCAYRKAWQKSHVCRSVFGFKGQIYKTHHHTSTMESPRSNKLSRLPGEGGSWGESQEKKTEEWRSSTFGFMKDSLASMEKVKWLQCRMEKENYVSNIFKSFIFECYFVLTKSFSWMPLKTSAGISARAPREVTPVLGAPLTAPSTPTAVDRYPTEVLKAWRRHSVLTGLPLCHFGSPQIQP